MRSPENAHHELASSNSTASAFLGGRRNPAWMTAAPPPPSSTSPTAVLPRKRPAPKEPVPPRRLSKQGPPRPASSASPKPACAPAQPAATAVPQNASSPASPALPNVVASQTAQPSHAVDNNVLPSPAPSEDMSAERGRAATVVSLEEDESDEEASSKDAQVPEGNGSNMDNNEKPGESLAERRNVSLSLTETRPRSTQSDQAAGSRDRFQRQSAPRSAGSRPHSATPVQPAPATAPSTRLASPQVQTPVTSPPADLNLPRWRTLPPQGMSCYATEFCLAELQHLNARSGNGKSLAGVEKVRVDLMVEAVMSSDRYYLIFHQIMCIGALSQDFLPLEIATLHGTAPALELLNHLVQTSHVSKGFLEWFADFPVNLHDKKRLWSEEYGQQLLHFKQFVALANGGWERLQAFCFRKQLPPTSIEIGRELGMRSRLFQTIINRAILRRLCNFQDPPTDDQSRFLSEAEKSFKEHQTRIEQLQPSVTQELAQEEQNAELWYRERVIQLKSIFNVAFSYQAPTQNTPQTRPSPQQNRQAFQSLPNSPAQQHMLPSELYNGQQYQPVRPRVSTEIPRPPSNEPPVPQYGPPTPTSTMSPFGAAAVVHHQSFHQNQQQPHQLIQHGGQVLMGPPNGVVTIPQSHNGHVQNWQLAQLQSPMSPAYPTVPAGWQTHPNGAYQQPIYHQQRPLAPAHPYNNVRLPPQHVLRTNSAPVHGAAHPASPRQNSQAEPQHQLFVPPPGHLWTPQMVDPDRTAMHQAHLKSPLLKATPDHELGRKLYQSVSGFAVAPTKLADNIAQQVFQFTISAEEKSSIPPEQSATLGVPATRLVSEASKMYRLRCVKTKNVEEHSWVLQDSAWPAGMFLTFNGQYLEPRKKGQHGKDLPIDISPYIREGANCLEVNFLRRPDEERASAFAVAVETVGILRHSTIKESCSRRVIPASDIVASIKRGLSGPEDDDECAIVDSNVTINLFEPFSSSRIYDIPVRGRSCLHRDCFDLEVFLKTRDRKDPSVPCSVDVWKCPICRADARPDSLIIDGFLVDVRKKLTQSGQINTRAIIVDGNGNWKPKPEDKQDTPHASREPTAEENRSRVTTTSATARMPSTAAEVIELD